MKRIGNRTNHPVAPLEDRFWLRVEKAESCWLWRGATNGRYGRIIVNGRSVLAHRVSWQMAFGPVPEGMSVLHHCDVTLCVKPSHLFVGTQADNMQDCAVKQRNGSQQYPERLARGARHGLRLHPERAATGEQHGLRLHPENAAKGEKHPHARLAETNVVLIRQLGRQGVPAGKLAERFKVSRRAIRDILNGVTWRHVSWDD